MMVGVLLLGSPVPQALADGAASTRNILLGIGAAAGTLIIINHNKKVHQKYAEDAQTEATLANQRNDAQAAYKAEVRAYDNQLAVTNELKKEVSVKDKVIQDQQTALQQQQKQLAQMGLQSQPIAAAAPAKSAPSHASGQVLSYGWGTL